jgi:Fe-S-cluster-containing dehydrogenase component
MIGWLRKLFLLLPLAEEGRGEGGGTASPAARPSAASGRESKQLALVIDLNVCVGCHACVTSCKEWNTFGAAGPLADENAYGANPTGTFFNRVQTYEAGVFPDTDTIHFPKSCLHCEEPPCVPVCPTGASYKRESDGIVLVDYDKCIGCKYCAWACPYGAREIDEARQVMTKCTLCVDRIDDPALAPGDRQPACVKACPTGARLFGDVKDPGSEVARAIRERGGYSLMPEWQTRPANQYLPRRVTGAVGAAPRETRELGTQADGAAMAVAGPRR